MLRNKLILPEKKVLINKSIADFKHREKKESNFITEKTRRAKSRYLNISNSPLSVDFLVKKNV